jgi:protein gp37
MAESTDITWTDATWNPIQGCTKVSPGCAHCYMYRDKARYGQDPSTVVRSAPATFNAPLARHGARATKGTPGSWKWPDGLDVFTASWSDFFHEAADPHRPDAWEVIRQRPGLRFFVLTKRPENIAGRLPPGWPLPNVLLGVTVERGDYLDRVARLLELPAAGRFVSAEPLLGDVASAPGAAELLGRVDWIIAGGESGPRARPMHPAWARGLRDLARDRGVPFHFKQWGEWGPADPAFPSGARSLYLDDGTGIHDRGKFMERVGVLAAGRLLDGRAHNARPRGAR